MDLCKTDRVFHRSCGVFGYGAGLQCIYQYRCKPNVFDFFFNSPTKISNHLFIFISLIWVFSVSTPGFLVWLWLTNITSIPPAEGILILYKLWFMFTVTLTLYFFLFLHKMNQILPRWLLQLKKYIFVRLKGAFNHLQIKLSKSVC